MEITMSRSAVLSALHERGLMIPGQRTGMTVVDLNPDHFGKRIVIRSGDFLGTVCGTLLDVHPHPSLVRFTSVQLFEKRLLTFRNDTEILVLS